jgi:hypothetical protein
MHCTELHHKWLYNCPSADSNDACTYGVSKCSFACIVSGSEDTGTVVPCHIHVSHAESNVSSVYSYFRICNKESVLHLTADDRGDKFLRRD